MFSGGKTDQSRRSRIQFLGRAEEKPLIPREFPTREGGGESKVARSATSEARIP